LCGFLPGLSCLPQFHYPLFCVFSLLVIPACRLSQQRPQ
jgi:hypothetical protein